MVIIIIIITIVIFIYNLSNAPKGNGIGAKGS